MNFIELEHDLILLKLIQVVEQDHGILKNIKYFFRIPKHLRTDPVISFSVPIDITSSWGWQRTPEDMEVKTIQVKTHRYVIPHINNIHNAVVGISEEAFAYNLYK